MSITREFHGFLVSDNFVLTLNVRGGTTDVNLQEMMALRLEGSTGDSKMQWYDSNQNSSGIATVTTQLGLSNNHQKNCRSAAKWLDAKTEFVNNNNLDVGQGKLLDSYSKRSADSNSGNGVVFTATHAKNLGMAVYESLPENLQVCVSAYDANSESHPHVSKIKHAMSGFKMFLGDAVVLAKQREYFAKQKIEQEQRDAKLAKLEGAAKTALVKMGFSEDNDNYDAMLKTQMALLESVLSLVD